MENGLKHFALLVRDMAVLDALPEHIALIDADGMIVAVNAAWRQFALENDAVGFGVAGGDHTGADYLALCAAARGAAADGAAEAAAGIRAVLTRTTPFFSLEYPCHAPDRQRWFLMTVVPFDQNGAAAIVIHLDISGRKLEELRRRDSELRLQLALDATGDGIWDWNPSTGEAYLSPSYYAMCGYRPEDEPGSFDFFQRLVRLEDWPQVMATVGAHLRGETPVSEVEYRITTASGEIRWISGRGRVIERAADGSPLRMIGLVTDITSIKRILQALHESEARYRGVVEDQTELICRLAVDGTFLFANEVYLRFFGKTADEVIGRQWQPVALPDDLAMIEARLTELAPDHPVVVIENRVFAGDGSVRWMQFINRGFFDTAGQLREIQSVGRDITARRELEERQRELLEENVRLGRELLRLQEAERAALAQELHDELSQQLVAIRAHAGAIVRRTTSSDDPTHLDGQAIGKVAGEIYSISHQLMEGLHPQALDCAGLVAAVEGLVDRWSRSSPKLQVRLRATLIGPCDAEVRINLFRIIQECLVNAVAHGHAGRIRIFIGQRQSDLQHRVRVVIRDDGVGMNLDAPRAGYGLILTRERARNLGGMFSLSSRPGHGLRVAVEVPLDH